MRGDRRLFTFVEMPTFTASRAGVLTDEELDRVMGELQVNPRAGMVVPESGGVRKIRVARGGKGKRGGGRVLYYFADAKGTVYLMFAYSKSDQADVTPEQKRMLRTVVTRISGE
jgi:hypothetical protein